MKAAPASNRAFSKIRKFCAQLGPGLITGVSDDDPSGIATYSQAGAHFGLHLLWTMLFTYPLMCSIQNISARVGRVTGHGLAGNLRRSSPVWILYPAVLLLTVVNTINLGVDLNAMGAAAQLVLNGSMKTYCVLFAIFSLIAQVFIPYHLYVRFIKWLTLSLFAYVFIVFFVHVPWRQALLGTFIPHFGFNFDSMQMLIALLGTTISPYLFFWQASQEVEDERLDPRARPLKQDPRKASGQFTRIKNDTLFGMGASNLIGFFIILTTAVTLHSSGITNIETPQQAAEALRPIAGHLCFLLFSLGMIGTGLLAIPVLAGSAAYAVGETFRWRTGLEMKPARAPRFYIVIAAATMLGLLMTAINVNPIRALFWTAVFNGILAVPIMPLMMWMASDKKIMGKLTIPAHLKWLGWTTTALMTLAAICLIK